MEIPRGRGVAKAKNFIETYGAKLDFPEGWGYKLKPLAEAWMSTIRQHNTIMISTTVKETLDPNN